MATNGTQVKAELSQAVGGDTRGQRLTRGEEALPGHAGARNKWATLGHQWDTMDADRLGYRNFGAGQALLGQYTGGSSRARNAAIHPDKGRVKASAGGTGDLSGRHSQALVWEGKAGLLYELRAWLAVGMKCWPPLSLGPRGQQSTHWLGQPF